MKAEAEQNAAADKAEREKIDKLNQADSMIFTTENFLKDNGDKIPADQKSGVESALQQLRMLTSQLTLQLSTQLSTTSTPLCRQHHSRCTAKQVHRAVLSRAQTLVSRSSQSRMTPSKMQTLRK